MRSTAGSNSSDAKLNRIDTGGEKLNRENATIGDLDSRFDQTLKSVHGLLKGQNLPGKVLLTRRPDNICNTGQQERSPPRRKSSPERGIAPSKNADNSSEEIDHLSKTMTDTSLDKQSVPSTSSDSTCEQAHKTSICARSTDSARVMKFTKELSASTMRLEILRELAWSGVPPYMRPNVWRLILGYAPSNSDRRQGVLMRKRLEYLDCVSLYYDTPDSERSNEEINMLRQITVDCPRTIPDIPFFQQGGIQKSLERILYTWGIRHPASGYVQGINDIVTPFLVVFLSEYFEGGLDNWTISNLSTETITAVEADCYWCLSKLLDGMQDHYTFAQPGIQRLVFKLKELVRRLDEPISRHMDEEGLEFLQFAFRWFNCLLVREIPFHLVIRLWDTYLAEGDALPNFLVYIFASFLLTWSNELKKLDFQEMVIFLQHLPTQNWTHAELEMVLSRAYMWHAMFNNSPRHLAT